MNCPRSMAKCSPDVAPWIASLLALILVTSASACDRGSAPRDGPEDSGTPGALSAPSGEDEGAALDHAGLARVLTERMSLQPGERVFLLGAPGRFDGIADELRRAVSAHGAEYLGAVSVTETPYSEEHETDFTRALESADDASRLELLRTADLGVMLPGATVGQLVYSAMQDVLREERGRTIHFHWEGAYSMDGQLFTPDANVDRTYTRSLLETDYPALGEIQSRFESAARAAEVHVTTPQGTDLRFRIQDRPATRQDGDASAARVERARNLIDREIELPAGALRVAPVEETVQGTIAFPPGVWNGEPVSGLVMRFEDGKIAQWSAESGAEAVRAELAEAGPAGQSFREFALGFNPTIQVPEDRSWIPYYGYGAGVVRLSLGDNTELGGIVGGGYVRWNFFTDTTVRVGEETWVLDGQLQVPTS